MKWISANDPPSSKKSVLCYDQEADDYCVGFYNKTDQEWYDLEGDEIDVDYYLVFKEAPKMLQVF